MVTSNSAARLSRIKKSIILAQTDTTVGFLSQNAALLREIKVRSTEKPFICVFHNFSTLKHQGIRIPNRYKRCVRRSKKRTYIVKDQAFRVGSYPANSAVLRQLQWSFSTSANESGKSYDPIFCEQKADIIVQEKHGLYEGRASELYKINNKRKKRLR